MQIAKIMPVNFRAAAAQQPLVSKPSEEKNADSNVSAKYLENLARLNAPAVKKIDLAAANKAPYKNNLRTMIQNNQAVMMALIQYIFFQFIRQERRMQWVLQVRFILLQNM